MNYIVGKGINRVYKNFKIMDDLNSTIDILKKDDVLVLHKVDSSLLDIGVAIPRVVNKGVEKIIYINKSPDVLIASTIRSNNGVVETDEELLEESSLEYIIDEYESMSGNSELVQIDGISILSDFIDAFLEGEDRIHNTMYQDRLITALEEVVVRVEKDSKQIISMGNSASRILQDVDTSLASQKVMRQKLLDTVTELKQKLSSQTSVNTVLSSNSVYNFPTVRYEGTKPILHIKEIVECRYITSFIMGYLNYLEIVKHKKVKFIICYQGFKDITDRYKGFTNMQKSNIKIRQLLEERILVTQEPKKEVLSTMIDSTSDVVVILDKMYGESIVDGVKVKRLYTVNGVTTMNKLNLKPSKCILPEKTMPNLFIGIPKISNYPKDEETRKKAYMEVCKDSYKKLDRLLEI